MADQGTRGDETGNTGAGGNDLADEEWAEVGAPIDPADVEHTRIRALLADNEDLHVELRNLSREVLQLRDKLNKKDKELLDLRSRVVERDRLISDGQGERRSLEQRLSSLQGSLSSQNDARASADQAVERVEQLEREVERHVTEIEAEIQAHARTRDLLAKTADERDAKGAELASLQPQLKASQDEITRLGKALWDLRRQHGQSITLLDQIRSLFDQTTRADATSTAPLSTGSRREATPEPEPERGSQPDPQQTVRDKVAVLGLAQEESKTRLLPDPGDTVRDKVAVLGEPVEDQPDDETQADINIDGSRVDAGETVRDRVAILGRRPNDANESMLTRLRDPTIPALERLEPFLSNCPTVGAALTSSEMNPRVASVLARIDGTASLERVLIHSGLPPDEAAELLVDLFLRGLIRVPG